MVTYFQDLIICVVGFREALTEVSVWSTCGHPSW